MPNFTLQQPTYYEGVKSYDDRSFIQAWTIQTKDQMINKLYFSNIAGFSYTGTNTTSTNGLNKSTVAGQPLVNFNSFDSSYANKPVKPYLIDNTLPVLLPGVASVGSLAAQIVDWKFNSTDWFEFAGTAQGGTAAAFAGITKLTFYTDTTTGAGYEVTITPIATAAVAGATVEFVAQFQLAVGANFTGTNCTIGVAIATVAPSGSTIKAIVVANPAVLPANTITPRMVYQTNNREQFPGTSIAYRFCCIDAFNWERSFDKAERLCSGRVTDNPITKETNTVSLTIKEEDAIIWALMTGQMPSIVSEEYFNELNGYEKGNNNVIPSTATIGLPTKPKIVGITTKDCANLQLINSSAQVNLGENNYSYDITTGELKFNSALIGQSISIVVAEVKDATKVDIIPLVDGYKVYLQVQRRGKNGRLKVTKFANVQLTMPTVSAEDTGDTLEMSLNVANANKNDISISFL